MPLLLFRLRPPGRGPARVARGLVTAAVALAMAVAPASAEDMALSPDLQVPIILRLLAYDRHLESRAGEELMIGILYPPTDPDAVKAANALSDTLFRFTGKTVKRLPFRYMLVEYTTPEGLERSVTARGIDILYVTPGNAKNLQGITKVSQGRGITTTTGVPEYVRGGVCVGLLVSQGRAQPIINLASCRDEGVEFDASLLRISTVVNRTVP